MPFIAQSTSVTEPAHTPVARQAQMASYHWRSQHSACMLLHSAIRPGHVPFESWGPRNLNLNLVPLFKSPYELETVPVGMRLGQNHCYQCSAQVSSLLQAQYLRADFKASKAARCQELHRPIQAPRAEDRGLLARQPPPIT